MEVVLPGRGDEVVTLPRLKLHLLGGRGETPGEGGGFSRAGQKVGRAGRKKAGEQEGQKAGGGRDKRGRRARQQELKKRLEKGLEVGV